MFAVEIILVSSSYLSIFIFMVLCCMICLAVFLFELHFCVLSKGLLKWDFHEKKKTKQKILFIKWKGEGLYASLIISSLNVEYLMLYLNQTQKFVYMQWRGLKNQSFLCFIQCLAFKWIRMLSPTHVSFLIWRACGSFAFHTLRLQYGFIVI